MKKVVGSLRDYSVLLLNDFSIIENTGQIGQYERYFIDRTTDDNTGEVYYFIVDTLKKKPVRGRAFRSWAQIRKLERYLNDKWDRYIYEKRTKPKKEDQGI